MQLFGRTIFLICGHICFAEVEDDDFEPPEAKLDEYHPKATRTLFVGNLEKEISTQSLRDTFKPYGEIIVSIHACVLCFVSVRVKVLNIAMWCLPF